MNTEHKTPLFYTGKNRENQHLYGTVESMEQNNGKAYTGQYKFFKSKLHKNDTIGGIHLVTFKDGSIFYKATSNIVGYWKNDKDIAVWQLENRAVEAQLKMLKDGKKNEYEEILIPIREAYRKAGYKEKTIILAEAIRIITN